MAEQDFEELVDLIIEDVRRINEIIQQKIILEMQLNFAKSGYYYFEFRYFKNIIEENLY